jgi:hypothetical protein
MIHLTDNDQVYIITVQIQYLGIWMIHIVEGIKLLMLPSDLLVTSRLATVRREYPRKHIRGNGRYLVTWNAWEFSVGYFSILDKSERQKVNEDLSLDKPLHVI